MQCQSWTLRVPDTRAGALEKSTTVAWRTSWRRGRVDVDALRVALAVGVIDSGLLHQEELPPFTT